MRVAKFAVAVLAAVLLAGCQGEVDLEVVAGVDACHECGMVIDQVNQACGYLDNRELVTFDSPGCLLRSYDQKRAEGFPVPDQVFFADYGDGSWHPAQSTAFLLTEYIPSVMNAGVLSFGSAEAAEARRLHPDERVTDWNGYRTTRGKPDRVDEVVFSSTGMVPEVLEVDKGDLVLWKVSGEQLKDDLQITIEGYPEIGTITVPASGQEKDLRFLALRPGMGFPVIEVPSREALGRVKVRGAHTLDEEEM